ncbi:MAG: phosphoribosyltransferase family protein, partial [Gammaproteobacteria bacterium]|nr:phosphoribosyltransferase family protein [Gammaproteobacteria bacterium]
QQLLDDSYALGLKILESDFLPDYIVGVWRGGAPVGIAVQELLSYFGVETDHIAIRTSLYTGIKETSATVQVHGLHYLIENVNAEDKVLIVDDVFDSGRSINQVIVDLKQKCRRNTPEFRIATPYYKPRNNKTDRIPDYFLHETDDWLVFPHELDGLTVKEILANKPGIEAIRDKLMQKCDSD